MDKEKYGNQNCTSKHIFLEIIIYNWSNKFHI